MRLVLCLLLPAAAAFSASGEVPALRSAAEIRALPESVTAEQPAAILEGVVTLESSDEESPIFFLTDASATMLVTGNRQVLGFQPRGARIRVEGEVRAGHFAPFVFANRILNLGTAAIPSALPVSIDELQTGSHAQQWVALRGVVRRTDPMPPNSAEPWRFDLSTGGSRITVLLRGQNALPPPVDAEVLVEGVCFTQFTSNRQILNPRIVIPEGCGPRILSPAPPHPPERSLDQVMAFRPDSSNAHRARVRGTVTHSANNGIWIQSASGALRVLPLSPLSAPPGTALEAVGFARREGTSFVLEDAVCSAGAPGQPPEPTPVDTPADALSMDGRLLRMEGWFTHSGPAPQGGQLLFLETQSGPVHVHLPATEKMAPGCSPGAWIAATGICMVLDSENKARESRLLSAAPTLSRRELIGPMVAADFQLLARTGADIRVLQPPPFWSSKRLTGLLLGIAVLTTGLLLATLAASRRRVRAAAAAARLAEAESAAVWSERTRIARELHDTLAQDFASLALQLELLRSHVPPDGKPGEHLAQAGSIVRQSLSETRDAIWMLRGDALRESGLPAALEGLLQRLLSRSNVSFEFLLEGRPVQLPHVTEHHLLRITKECVQNALRHASPHKIHVQLRYGSKSVGLQIQDDGCGFDSSSADSAGHAAGFGLRGLKERVDEIQGTLQIQSGKGQGTRIQIDFPTP